jgi:hypothetical protein
MLKQLAFVAICVLFQPSEELYYGSRMFVAYLKVKADSAFVDLIYVDKFPRDILTDTLVLNRTNGRWAGKSTDIVELGNKYKVKTIQDSSVFAGCEITVKRNEKEYRKYIESDRKYAAENRRKH